MNNLSAPISIEVVTPIATSKNINSLHTLFNRFNKIIMVIEKGKLQLLNVNDSDLIRQDLDFILYFLSKLAIGAASNQNILVETYRPIVLEKYRRVVRIKLTVLDESDRKKNGRLRADIIDILFNGLDKLITIIEG